MKTDGVIFGFVNGSVRLTLNWKLCENTLHIKPGIYRNEKVRNPHKTVREFVWVLWVDIPNECQ